MIEGECGGAILSQVVAYRMDAIVDGDQISASLIAACIADALRKGTSPRSIANDLWEGLPSDEQWVSMRGRVMEAIEEMEEAT